MKKIPLHPGLILLNFAFIALLISIIGFQRNTQTWGIKPAYEYRDDFVFYLDKPMFEVDMESFKVLEGGYAVDADTVFYDGREVIGIDRNSFAVLGYGIAKDNQGVWVFNRLMEKSGTNVKALGNLYYQVDDEVYYFDTLVENADLETFTPLPKDYLAQDKNGYIYRGSRIDLDK